MKQVETTIQHTSWHLMNFITCQIIGYAFRFAFENELADLKELIHPDSFCELREDGYIGSIELELKLLYALDDPAIRILLDSIERIIECRNMLELVNNLDFDKMVVDLLAIQLTGNICDQAEGMLRDAGDYKTLLLNSTRFYEDLAYQIYIITEMYNTNKLHVIGKETYKQFDEQYPDILLEDQVSDDKNVDLLYKLMIELDEDNDRIQDLELKDEQN